MKRKEMVYKGKVKKELTKNQISIITTIKLVVMWTDEAEEAFWQFTSR